MWFLYYTITILYTVMIRLAALYSGKAALWVNGRKKWDHRLQSSLPKGRPVIWIHCASLGEFEMGRPVIEKLRKEKPEFLILLTFFSPSGFEIRKNYSGADIISYLPADIPGNADRFVQIVNPVIAVFVKYEFWFGFIHSLKKNDIPVLLISARFRTGQMFFRSYGTWFRKQLKNFAQIHVQDIASESLLSGIGMQNISVSGDTRFDRVAENATHIRDFPEIKKWIAGRPCIIAGSTWPVDDDLMLPWNITGKVLIVAPHEIHASRIRQLMEKSGNQAITYSDLLSKPDENYEDKSMLIIDNIGMLLSLYALGSVAYVGGGFGSGLHNILEPAAFGVPVIFGPRHEKFPEASALEEAGGGRSVQHVIEFRHALEYFTNPSRKDSISSICRSFVAERRGATDLIMEAIRDLLNKK